MGIYIPIVLVSIMLLMIIISSVARDGGREPGTAWWIVIGLVGLLAVLRAFQIINEWRFFLIYGVMVTINYLITYHAAYFVYKDPVTEYKGDFYELKHTVKVHYVIPVYNEPGFISRCIESIVQSANAVRDVAEVVIVVVNDASTDNTWLRLREFVRKLRQKASRNGDHLPHIKLINLQNNAGKKGAIAAGTCGGENWREGFQLFDERFGRKPTKEDYEDLIQCLKEVGCNSEEADFYMHTDSDSVISKDFIRYMIMGFLSDKEIGSISGHCDVWLDSDEEPTFFTRLQIAWYFTQFRIRKAAESAYNSVFCVSGPGAGFRSEAVLHLMPQWVDDEFGGRIYRGATDRMLTLLVLKDRWKVVYSGLARVWTVVPSTSGEARRQWTRWKQNFWRMFVPVWRFAWRVHPAVAYLTYTRLIVTVLAPYILAYHLIWAFMGGILDSILYITGIAVMGSLMGMAYITRNPKSWHFALLRPVISVMSAFWGSVLTLRAMLLSYHGSFTWREGSRGQSNRWGYYKWLGFDPTFEMHFIEVILIVMAVVYIIRYFFG